MSQKQAISQTPIDLKPEDETKAGGAGAKGAPDAAAGARPEGGQPRQAQEPQPGRAPSPRRIPDSRDGTVQVSPGTSPARHTPQRRPAAAARPHIPANDDMPSIGGLIYALQQRPSRSPFLIALIASAVWFVLGVA